MIVFLEDTVGTIGDVEKAFARTASRACIDILVISVALRWRVWSVIGEVQGVVPVITVISLSELFAAFGKETY